MRLLIVGGPKTGKTTLAKQLGELHKCSVYATDDLKEKPWSWASQEASFWFDRSGPWIIEGTMAVRALRKWLRRNETGLPFDNMEYLTMPYSELTQGQASMAKAVNTIMNEIALELIKRIKEKDNHETQTRTSQTHPTT